MILGIFVSGEILGVFPAEKGNGLVPTAKGPCAPKTARTNTILILTMLNELTFSSAPSRGSAMGEPTSLELILMSFDRPETSLTSVSPQMLQIGMISSLPKKFIARIQMTKLCLAECLTIFWRGQRLTPRLGLRIHNW